MKLLVFDNDGVLRDESVSYSRCIRETIAFFDNNIEATESEMKESMKQSNNDWERTYNILKNRSVSISFDEVKEHFQNLYLGKKRDFTGYINNEPWLADNSLLEKLSKNNHMAIVSGAPKEELKYTLKKNNAHSYFSLILGMFDCKDKKEGIEKAFNHFKDKEIFFCDDRPSPIKKALELSESYNLKVYGIMPPQSSKDWKRTLEDAGAKKVFHNINDYCNFLLQTV